MYPCFGANPQGWHKISQQLKSSAKCTLHITMPCYILSARMATHQPLSLPLLLLPGFKKEKGEWNGRSVVCRTVAQSIFILNGSGSATTLLVLLPQPGVNRKKREYYRHMEERRMVVWSASGDPVAFHSALFLSLLHSPVLFQIQAVQGRGGIAEVGKWDQVTGSHLFWPHGLALTIYFNPLVCPRDNSGPTVAEVQEHLSELYDVTLPSYLMSQVPLVILASLETCFSEWG